MGRPLAAIVDVFGLWRNKYGDDSSLLAMLAFQAMRNASSADANAGGASHGGAESWRVGIHLPIKDDDSIVQHAAKLAVAAGHNKVSKVHLVTQNVLPSRQDWYTTAAALH